MPKVVVVSSSRHEGPVLPSALEVTARRPILLVACLKNVASTIYLIVCVLIMCLSTPGQKVRTRMYKSTSWSPALYISFCVLHLAAMLPTRSWSPSSNRWTRLTRRLRLWTSSDTMRAAFQAIETTVQALQGYHISLLCVDRDIILVYALLISVRCLLVPWLLFSSNPFVKTTLILAINSLVSFGIAVGISMVRFLPPLLMAVAGDIRITYSPVWITRNVLQARMLLPMSGLDLVEKGILLGANVVNVRRLFVAVAEIPKTPRAPLGRASTAPSILGPTTSISCSNLALHRPSSVFNLHLFASQSLRTVSDVGQTLQFRRKRMLTLFLIYQLLVGAVVLFNIVDLVWLRSPCPRGCQLQTYRWFSRSCSCAYLRINCADPTFENATLSTSLAPTLWGPSVFFLHLSQCDLPSGLDLRLLAPFTGLFGIAIEFANMTSWDAPPNVTWPPSLLGINLRYGTLTAIPSVLYTLPPQLQAINIIGYPFQTVPRDVFARWTSIAWLGLAGAQLTSLPGEMTSLVHLERLILNENRLDHIPTAWATAFPHLQRYELSGNVITTLPPMLVDAKPKALVDLSNNPVQVVPLSAHARIASRQILLDGTPFCTASGVDGCRPACADTCSHLNVGDNVCHVGCLSDKCAWDDGDCTAFGTLVGH